MGLRYLNMSQLAEVTGIDRRTVKDRLQGIDPHAIEGKAIVFDATAVLPILLGLEKVDQKATFNAIQKETLRLEKAKADKIELEVAKIRGEQVPIQDVAAIVEKEYSAVRSQLIAIPTKTCLELSTIDDPAIIKSKLQDAINECLIELSADENFKDNVIPVIGENDEYSTDSSTEESGFGRVETKAEHKLS